MCFFAKLSEGIELAGWNWLDGIKTLRHLQYERFHVGSMCKLHWRTKLLLRTNISTPFQFMTSIKTGKQCRHFPTMWTCTLSITTLMGIPLCHTSAVYCLNITHFFSLLVVVAVVVRSIFHFCHGVFFMHMNLFFRAWTIKPYFAAKYEEAMAFSIDYDAWARAQPEK